MSSAFSGMFLLAVARGDLDALRAQEGGHRRIGVGVRTRDLVAAPSHGRSDSSHGCAAYPDKVNVLHVKGRES